MKSVISSKNSPQLPLGRSNRNQTPPFGHNAPNLTQTSDMVPPRFESPNPFSALSVEDGFGSSTVRHRNKTPKSNVSQGSGQTDSPDLPPLQLDSGITTVNAGQIVPVSNANNPVMIPHVSPIGQAPVASTGGPSNVGSQTASFCRCLCAVLCNIGHLLVQELVCTGISTGVREFIGYKIQLDDTKGETGEIEKAGLTAAGTVLGAFGVLAIGVIFYSLFKVSKLPSTPASEVERKKLIEQITRSVLAVVLYMMGGILMGKTPKLVTYSPKSAPANIAKSAVYAMVKTALKSFFPIKGHYIAPPSARNIETRLSAGFRSKTQLVTNFAIYGILQWISGAFFRGFARTGPDNAALDAMGHRENTMKEITGSIAGYSLVNLLAEFVAGVFSHYTAEIRVGKTAHDPHASAVKLEIKWDGSGWRHLEGLVAIGDRASLNIGAAALHDILQLHQSSPRVNTLLGAAYLSGITLLQDLVKYLCEPSQRAVDPEQPPAAPGTAPHLPSNG